ncbi:LLM class F420-dependent oxidoreductase [Mycobacterium intermedium]|uniref:LLM class F420-dependent oxidoreductase n=1 Tax=Mycobacterium intermedium TaxID=28445 RepID=A0A1E3SI93_MYCIE|nr:LLM class F420-dependent oxidoreductase [Mycobacterium intermedium]MCV6964364.1 LLM class F420-dependent oxidoreductase [Mycobacterium intermedium]ODR01849.1 LLM class F420-dependent oxidoreductase [Mycobacterium intermedium]OPE46114.1 LLM class F420-dependent oxidoreductase [Mycobacterium intermedium]ORB08579.1 LLM class F420-dependent oxidoreductase [Mycobacterium intermedium]
MAIKLGFQIPKFSHGTGVEKLFPSVIAQAKEAEEAGYDALFVMDHFYQLPMLGLPEDPMLEAYTALGALATATERLQLGTLVTGNTYRNPALLAKIITTLDVVSAGRAILGIGAGWYELEHRQLGFEFGTFTDRFNRLEEALQILQPMTKGERVTFSGDWYTTESAMAEPRYRDHIPLLIGGGGEKKTFAIAARWADHLNIVAALDELPRKVDALAARLDEAGRDRSTLETSLMLTVMIDEKLNPDHLPERVSGRMVAGSPERVADQVKAKILDVGVDGVILNLSPHGFAPGLIKTAAEALRPLLAA